MNHSARMGGLLAATVAALLMVWSGMAAGNVASHRQLPRAAAHHVVPVLGSKAFPGSPDSVGFGTAHPARIFNGGDPSGEALHLHWTRWGRARTEASGKTFVNKPKGGFYKRKGRIELVASHLGHCTANGRLAYRHLHARVAAPGMSFGHWFRWSDASNICQPLS